MNLLLVVVLQIVPLFADTKLNVTVKGMVCSFCAQGIEKKFKAMPEVKSVSVDLDSKIVSLELNKDKVLADAVIEKTIKDAGYEVIQLKKSESQK